jgi:hypothetical protein
MEWTLGAALFYGGLAGAALSAVAAVITVIVFTRSRKRIREKLNQEYGNTGK